MKKIFITTMVTLIIAVINLSSQINNVVVCNGEQVCLVAGSFQGTIQWQSSLDMISWADISSATNDTACLSASGSNYYRASIVNGTCDPVYSDTTFLTAVTASGIDTFFFTGAFQQFTVPCVDSITIICYGAQGGDVTVQSPYPVGAFGATMSGKFDVTEGDILTIVVGQKGNSDPSSAGGGGASGVANGSTPYIVAGGGAGFDFQDPSYPGAIGNTSTSGTAGNGGGGAGGTAGSDGDDLSYAGNNTSRGGRGWNSGNSGSMGADGSTPNTTFTSGTFGLGGGGGSVGYGWCNCGGGGGGYSGGGSGNINQSGGGGGSYNIGTNQNNTAGSHAGAGMVIIIY
jgi:hypothetical protein